MSWWYPFEFTQYIPSKKKNKKGVTEIVYSKCIEDEECDIQPTSKEKFNKDYGYNIDVTAKVFSPIEVNEGDLIYLSSRTKEGFYTVQKVVQWDEYFIFGVLDYKGIPNIEEVEDGDGE